MMPTLMMPAERRRAADVQDDPIAILLACHEKVRHFCDTLHRLVEHVPQHGADEQAKEAAQGVLRYFDSAAPRHHEDEEIDLFPKLRAAANVHPQMRDTLAELSAEHCYLEAAWQRTKVALEALLDGQPGQFNSANVTLFATRYVEHAMREERDVFPYATQLLSAEELADIAHAMVNRRRTF